MKSLLALAIVAGVSFAADVAPAKADPYKWCAMYGSNAIDGSKGCWFVTLQQCEETVRGLAGFCIPNTFSGDPAPAAADHGKRAKKRHS